MGYHQCADIKVNKIDCEDDLKFQGMHIHKHQFTEIKSAAFTADINDNGKVFLIDTTAVITLPAVASQYGPYIFVNYGEETAGISDVQISVSPNTNDRISGCDLATTENKDVINTLATAKKGDYIKIVYGSATGWSIAEMRGTWAIEG